MPRFQFHFVRLMCLLFLSQAIFMYIPKEKTDVLFNVQASMHQDAADEPDLSAHQREVVARRVACHRLQSPQEQLPRPAFLCLEGSSARPEFGAAPGSAYSPPHLEQATPPPSPYCCA